MTWHVRQCPTRHTKFLTCSMPDRIYSFLLTRCHCAVVQMYTPLEDMASSIPVWKGLAFIFLPALLAFVLLDGVFIAFVAGPMFQAVLQDLLRPSPDLVAGVLAWLCIVGMVYCFALPRSRSNQAAFFNGAWVGLFLYGTYELTNMSVISTWRWTIVASDMAWGSFACGVACCTMYLLQSSLTSRH